MAKGPRSFLFSVLAKVAKETDAAAFRARYPNDWIVWEAGRWEPPRAGSTVQYSAEAMQQMLDRAASGEALVLSLSPAQDPGGAPAELALGRGQGCELQINDGTLSGRHLGFRAEPGGGWSVRDLGSTNGSALEGAPLDGEKPRRLRSGAKLQAGQVKLTFYGPDAMYQRLVSG